MSAATSWNLMSVHTTIGYIRLSVHEMMGLMAHGVLWVLIIPYNHGNGSKLSCRFLGGKSFSVMVNCLVCCVIQAPTLILRADILLVAILGGSYSYFSLLYI